MGWSKHILFNKNRDLTTTYLNPRRDLHHRHHLYHPQNEALFDEEHVPNYPLSILMYKNHHPLEYQ